MGNVTTAANYAASTRRLRTIALAGITIMAAGLLQEPLILAFAAKFVISTDLFGRKRR